MFVFYHLKLSSSPMSDTRRLTAVVDQRDLSKKNLAPCKREIKPVRFIAICLNSTKAVKVVVVQRHSYYVHAWMILVLFGNLEILSGKK